MKKSVYKNLLLISFLSFAVYGNHIGNSFHFDGVEFIVQNQTIRDLNHIPYVLKETFTQRSITQISFVLNYYFGQYNPVGYHLVNLFLHTLNGILIFILVYIAQESLSKEKKYVSKHFIPLCTSVLFVIHPIQTESVVYIMSRSELLFSFFYLLAFILFQLFIKRQWPQPNRAAALDNQQKTCSKNRFLQDNSVINDKQGLLKTFLVWLGILLLFAMAIGSKESAATFPGIAFLYYLVYAPSGSPIICFLKKWRYVIAGVLLIALLGLFWKLLTDESFLMGRPTTAGEEIGRKNYMLTEMFVVVIFYIKLLFFPINLNPDTDISIIKSVFDPFFCFPAIFLIIASIWIFQKNRNKMLVLGFLWYIITISPTSSIITLLDFAAEHRLYLPSLGFFIMASYGLNYILARKNSYIIKSKNRRLLICCILIIFLSANTMIRNNDWRSSLTLWEDTVKKSPKKGRSYANLAYAYDEVEDIDNAIKANKKAIELSYGTFRVHYNLGDNYIKKGRIDDAKNELFIALRLEPRIPEAYGKLGDIYMDESDFQKADFYYKKAVEINPYMDVVFKNLGVLNYYHLKNYREAYLYFSRSLYLNPKQDQAIQIKELLKDIKRQVAATK